MTGVVRDIVRHFLVGNLYFLYQWVVKLGLVYLGRRVAL
jgi:hypothetical protein